MPHQNQVSIGSRPRMGNLGKLRKNALTVPVRSSILHECRSHFATQAFRWNSTINRFLFLITVSSTSSDSEMNVDSKDSEIYYKLIYLLVFC